MEDEKKSFIIYASYEENFEILSLEDRGKLITAIFEYNRTREVPELDGVLKMAFSFIKNNLDRDYKKWEGIKEVRKEAGKKGGLASAESRAKQTEANQANATFAQANEAKVSKAKQSQANQAVNVNGNVNDNVNGTVTVNGLISDCLENVKIPDALKNRDFEAERQKQLKALSERFEEGEP